MSNNPALEKNYKASVLAKKFEGVEFRGIEQERIQGKNAQEKADLKYLMTGLRQFIKNTRTKSFKKSKDESFIENGYVFSINPLFTKKLTNSENHKKKNLIIFSK